MFVFVELKWILREVVDNETGLRRFGHGRPVKFYYALEATRIGTRMKNINVES